MSPENDPVIPDPDEDIDLSAVRAARGLHDTLVSDAYQCGFEPEEDDDGPRARERRNPDAEEARTQFGDDEIAQLLADLQITENFEIYKHLGIMPKCVEVLKKQRGDTPDGGKGPNKPLENTVVITIHHLDDKAYGAHAVLREWGATDMTAIFVGYNQLMNEIYRPQINDIPDDQFRTCIMTGLRGAGASMFAEKTYSMVRDFNKFPANDALPNAALDSIFAGGEEGGRRLTYLQAMRCLAVFLFLRAVKRAVEATKKLLVFEDGGYLHPIINEACLEDLTVAQFRAKHRAPADDGTDSTLGADRRLREVLEGVFVGSTEMTRNGYNRDVRVQRDKGRGKLVFPIFSIACSRLKTGIEGDTIAVACLHAVAAVLYSVGLSVKHRTVVLMGARGSIGRLFARHIADLLEDPSRQLMCCDVKVGLPPPGKGEVPPWADAPDKPIQVWREDASGRLRHVAVQEAAAYRDFDAEDLKRVDLIFGLTGGPTQLGRPTVSGDDMENWLINGHAEAIYLSSGSTKTAEFSDVLMWLDALLKRQGDGLEITVHGRKLISIKPETIKDNLAEAALKETVTSVNKALPSDRVFTVSDFLKEFRRSFGTRTFTLEGRTPSAAPITKQICLLYKTYPINFMFYGTPAEVLDWNYAQLLDVTAMLAILAAELPTAEVYAVDYSIKATEGVLGATALDRDYPVPDPSGLPLV